MTPKQLSKLETRIATLKQSNRIVWIEGINTQVIKGKIAGKPVFFVKADSLNANGGSWYYIARWTTVGYECSCEYQGYKQCQHIPQVSEYNYQQYQREFRKHVAALEAERKQHVSTPASRLAREGKPFASYRDEQGHHSVSCVGHEIADVVVVPMSSEVMAEIATREEVMAERKLATFEQAMDEQYASDPRRGLSQGEVEAAQSYMRHYDDRY